MNKEKENKSGVKKVLRLLLCFIIAFSVYRLIVELGSYHVAVFYVGVTAYTLIIAVLFCIFYAKNGYTFSNSPLDESMLPEDMPAKEKTEFIKKYNERRQGAKKLLYVIIPMLLTVLIDYVMLVLSDFFA